MRDVAQYYNRNTKSFLARGRGSRRSATIHRALWAPGVATLDQAMDYVHQRIIVALGERRSSAAASPGRDAAPSQLPHFADLGCGVGASAARIGTALHARTTGVTLSAIQAEIAAGRIADAGAAGRQRVIVGDFTDSRAWDHIGQWGLLDGAWMIEAFNHGRDAHSVLTALAAACKPGAVVAICDDLPDDARPPRTRHEQFWEREFLRGWHVHTWNSAGDIAAAASKLGFEHLRTEDFSDWVAVDRPRDFAVRAVAGPAAVLGLRSGFWDNIRGGNALQQLGKRRIVRYQMVVLRRR
jgi:SAM-dependent methyltransferase